MPGIARVIIRLAADSTIAQQALRAQHQADLALEANLAPGFCF